MTSGLENTLVIFDCDGVLVDSETIACQAEAEVLTTLGYSVTSEDVFKKFLGVEKQLIAETVYVEKGVILPTHYPQMLHQNVILKLAATLQPIQNIHKALKNIPNKCVASGGPIDKIHMCLNITDLKKYFENHLIFSADMAARPKPAPDIHLFVMDKMGYTPEKCIVVEDSPVGVQAAKNAGLRVLAYVGSEYARDQAYRESLRLAGADLLFDDMLELNSHLTKMSN